MVAHWKTNNDINETNTMYNLYVGRKLVGIAESLGEVYRYTKVIHTLGLYYEVQPLARMRGKDLSQGFIVSYILFEVDSKLYIRPLKVIKCQNQQQMPTDERLAQASQRLQTSPKKVTTSVTFADTTRILML